MAINCNIFIFERRNLLDSVSDFSRLLPEQKKRHAEAMGYYIFRHDRGRSGPTIQPQVASCHKLQKVLWDF